MRLQQEEKQSIRGAKKYIKYTHPRALVIVLVIDETNLLIKI